MNQPKPRKPNFEKLDFWGAAEDFIEETNFDRDLIKDVVRFPDDTSRDPRSMEVGYNIYRFRRGDITVCVGFRDPENPRIIYVYLHDPEDHTRGKGTRAGGGLPSKTPGSTQEMQAWLRKAGCKLEWDRRSATMKVTWEGHYVGRLHLTVHQQGNALKNQFHHFRKRLTSVKTETRLRDDIEKRGRE